MLEYLYQKEIEDRYFAVKFEKMFANTCFEEHLSTTASKYAPDITDIIGALH